MIYLIHLERPIGGEGRNSAQHYLGWTNGNPYDRLADHRRGNGSALLNYCNKVGIDYGIVRLYDGDRTQERRMKNAGHHRERCPMCRA